MVYKIKIIVFGKYIIIVIYNSDNILYICIFSNIFCLDFLVFLYFCFIVLRFICSFFMVFMSDVLFLL